MTLFLYAAVLVGLAFLVADVAGRFRVEPGRLGWWRAIASAAAIAAGTIPTVFALQNPGGIAFPFQAIAAAYAAAAAAYIVGLAIGERAGGVHVRRIGYGVLLALATLPSWVLLFLAPIVGMAGIGLARPDRSSLSSPSSRSATTRSPR